MSVLLWAPYTSGIISVVCHLVILLSISYSGFIYGIAFDRISFFVKARWYFIIVLYMSCFLLSLMENIAFILWQWWIMLWLMVQLSECLHFWVFRSGFDGQFPFLSLVCAVFMFIGTYSSLWARMPESVCVSKFDESEIYLDSSSTSFIELESLSLTQSSVIK